MSKELGELTFREKPDISQVFLRQLDRTNLTASMTYQDSINQILVLLPSTWRRWVYDQEDLYTETKPTLMFKKFSERRIGSQKSPKLRNKKIPVSRLEDGTIDWLDPNIVSPILKPRTEINYLKFNELVMEAAENAGLTWQIEKREKVIGDLRQLKRKKTPYRKPRENMEEDIEDEITDEKTS